MKKINFVFDLIVEGIPYQNILPNALPEHINSNSSLIKFYNKLFGGGRKPFSYNNYYENTVLLYRQIINDTVVNSFKKVTELSDEHKNDLNIYPIISLGHGGYYNANRYEIKNRIADKLGDPVKEIKRWEF